MHGNKYSIYVHIPFCKARCGYCAFCSCTDYSLADRYFDKLFAEIEHFSDKTKPIYTVYIGGGTPSTVGTKRLDALFGKLRECFDMSAVDEITVECNPESADLSLLQCLARNGVDRVSFGLQSVNNDTLRRIGRLHTFEDFLNALDLARKVGIKNVNADLILGLPETKEDFFRSVACLARLPVSHVSVYALELHEGTPLFAQFADKPPFTDDEQADMYDKAVQLLAEMGLERYEISNFAKRGYECKHNLNYWQEGRYFAFGASASGFVENERFTQPQSVQGYLDASLCRLHETTESISLAEEANEFVMLGLRLAEGISLSKFSARYNADFWTFFSSAKRLAEQGFLTVTGDRVAVPEDKFYVVDSVLAELWHSNE